MSDTPKQSRHMISITPEVFERLDQFKAELEKRLQFRVSYAQAITWLINHQQKEEK